MAIGITLSGGGGGGGASSIVKVADAAARLALATSDGLLVLQLDNNILYEYDTTAAAWLVLADPSQIRRVADAAALAALTPVGDGDLAIQLDTSELYEYKLATTDWVKIGGIGTLSTYAGYDNVTGEMISIPGALYLSSATQFFNMRFNPTLVATLTEIQSGALVDTAVDGQTATDLRGFTIRSNIGAATATVINNINPFAWQANIGANLTSNSINSYADSMGIAAGAAITDITSFNSYPTVNQATMNQYKAFQSAATFGNTDPAHINGFTGLGLFDIFGAQADLDGAYGVNISQNFLTGAVVDGYVGINSNSNFDVVGLNGFRGIELGGNFGQNSATTINDHIDFQSHPNYQANATLGSYTGLSMGPTFQTGSTITSNVQMLNWNPQFNNTVLSSYGGINANANLGNTNALALTNYVDANFNPLFGANLTLANYQGISVRANVNAGAAITGNASLLDLGINSSIPVAGSATGITVNMTNFATPAMPTAINSTGGNQLFANFDTGIYPVQTGGGPYGLNNIGGSLHIASGFPITGANFGIGNNLGISILAEDDIPVDSSGLRLGFLMNGFLTQIGATATSTVDSVTFMGAGAQDAYPGGGAGTFDEINMFRALGILPTNGAIINNIYGFKVDATLTAASPVNAWGFFCDAATADNYFAKSISIATATKKTANVDVGIEIGGTKTLLHGRLTTVQRDAIATPLAGMEIYNTDEDQLERYDGVTWEAVGSKLVVQAVDVLNDAVDFVPPNKRRQVCQVVGNAAAVSQTDIDITTAQEGDELMIIGTDNDDTVTFVSATNAVLNGSCTLALDDTISFIFVNGKFREFGRNN